MLLSSGYAATALGAPASDTPEIAVRNTVITDTVGIGKIGYNYLLSFKYGLNDANSDQFSSQEATATKDLQSAIKEAIDGEYAQYFTPGRKVRVTVTCTTENQQLAFLRTQSVSDFIKSNVFANKLLDANYLNNTVSAPAGDFQLAVEIEALDVFGRSTFAGQEQASNLSIVEQAKRHRMEVQGSAKEERDGNWWTRKPDRYQGFITAQIAFPWSGAKGPAYGGMVGVVKDWGFYFKGVYKSCDRPYEIWHPNDGALTTGKSQNCYYATSGGVIKRMWCPIHVYLGAGYQYRKQVFNVLEGSPLQYSPNTRSGAMGELGLMMNIGCFTIAGGVATHFSQFKIVGNIGVGVNF